MAEYAGVVVDISLQKLDRVFEYLVPERLCGKVAIGMKVRAPFGSRMATGYVVSLSSEAEYPREKIRELAGIEEDGVQIESQLIALADFMKRNYGGTMIQALKTVIPVRSKARPKVKRRVRLALSPIEAKSQLADYERRHSRARERLLRALIEDGEMDWDIATGKLGVSGSAIRAMEESGVVKIESETLYRNPVSPKKRGEYGISLNDEQLAAVETVMGDYEAGVRATYLLRGVTGSGKTEVYMELIARIAEGGRQAIVLIPEIALTYQTVMRFYERFGDRVSIMNSRMSQGERYDQFLRAKSGEVDIMIGPRSALFTPFPRLGLIIIDEEHEPTYKSEQVPRYHARETAIERARMAGASVILGSATPSVDSYSRALCGEYRLISLSSRARSSSLPSCEVVDMREELKAGNRSILSRRLSGLIEDRLGKGEQSMLFINRRGTAGFVSCRACGLVIKCPHCDVSLSLHGGAGGNGQPGSGKGGARLICHYCGHEEPAPRACPKCGSPYIGAFRAGTEKIEQVVRERFPSARVLRMDFDTTRGREGYEGILSSFASGEADILVGTQMIVKGHDFAGVTLVGILAADLSLHVGDYRAAERTFQLLTQAAGRAGRGELPGSVVIQTYDPEHYSIRAAQAQDYDAFYEQEIAYRRLLCYPPAWHMLVVLCASYSEGDALAAARIIAGEARARDGGGRLPGIRVIGPADAAVAKVSDVYKKVVYIKSERYGDLVEAKDAAERLARERAEFRGVTVQFDFDPVNGF